MSIGSFPSDRTACSCLCVSSRKGRKSLLNTNRVCAKLWDFFLKKLFSPRYSTVHSPTWETQTCWKDDSLQKPSFLKDANTEPRTLDVLGPTPSSHTFWEVLKSARTSQWLCLQCFWLIYSSLTSVSDFLGQSDWQAFLLFLWVSLDLDLDLDHYREAL